GGQSKSVYWNQMKANIVGLPVSVMRVPDAELIGNAAAGFTGLGVYPTIEEAAAALARIERTFDPEPDATVRYEDIFSRYISRYERLRHALADGT
ncbi:MAG: FGGY-family carbohydrate kinase, partial [Spirochaetales bacterium]